MSEQWRGHYARCLECENLCASGEPCRCCLAAEVEVLRAQVQRVRDLCDALRRTHQDYAAMVIEMTLDGSHVRREGPKP